MNACSQDAAGSVTEMLKEARTISQAFGAVAEGGNGPRSALAQYYITRLLPECDAALAEAQAGSAGVFSLTTEALGA